MTTFILPNSTQTFDVEVWFNPFGGTYDHATGYTIALGFASANQFNQSSSNANSSPITMSGQTGSYTGTTPPSNFSVVNHISGLNLANSGALMQGHYSATAGHNNPFNQMGTTGLRPYGVLFSAIGQPNTTGDLGNVSVKLATVHLQATNLFSVFGDDQSECGLIVYRHLSEGTGNPSFTSGIGGIGSSSGKFGSQKYKVMAVPEPGTMIALISGIAALSKRKRRSA